MDECGGIELGENKSDTSNQVGDIEQNTVTNFHPNTNSSREGWKMEAPQGDANVAPASASVSVVARLIAVSRKPMIAIGAILCCPFVALFMMITVVWGGRGAFKDSVEVGEEDKYKGSLYEKVQLYENSRNKVVAGSAALTSRLGCVLLVWLVMSTLSPQPLRPALKTATFLGLIHWKWSLLVCYLFLSHPFISFTLTLYGHICHQFIVDSRSPMYYYSYYIWTGLLDSLASLLHLASVFLLWMLYFHTHVGLNAGFDKYATMTLVALLVAALLWLLKTTLLLRWQQKAVYEKFRPRILMSVFRLSILCFFFDGAAPFILIPSWYQQVNAKIEEHDYLESPFFSKRKAREYIMSSAYVSLNQMKVAVEILSILAKISTPRSSEPEDENHFSSILDAYQQKIPTMYSYLDEATTDSIIRRFLGASKYRLLTDVIQAENPSKDINQVPFDKWVIDAHKNCLSVAYTLADAFAMVRVLDSILTSCLVMAVLVVWLLATELASTTVLIVIASPFLALSFVFGDVCKNFFQGFIFAFVTHPFNIGDRCIIDGVEVEVKRVNIMTTTCLKIGTNEKMMYPNSSLAANLIINLGDKFDPNDVVELVLHPSTNILDMKNHIQKFIDADEQQVLFEKKHKVVVKEINSTIKIIVYFQHKMDSKDISYSQFLEKKEGQRSTLIIEIKKFLENLGVEVAIS